MTSIRTTLQSHLGWAVAAVALMLLAASVASAAVLPSASPAGERAHVAVVVAAGDAAAVGAARRAVARTAGGELRIARSVTEQRSALIALAERGATTIVAVGLDTPGTEATIRRRRPATRIVTVDPAAAGTVERALAG